MTEPSAAIARSIRKGEQERFAAQMADTRNARKRTVEWLERNPPAHIALANLRRELAAQTWQDHLRAAWRLFWA